MDLATDTFTLTLVPEPATLALLAVSALAVLRRPTAGRSLGGPREPRRGCLPSVFSLNA